MITDAHYQSQQVGFEKLQTGLIPAMAGASIVSGVGGIDKDDTASLEQLVIDCDIWSSILRIARGFEVNDDTISFELMKRLGPNPDYQVDMETTKRFRKEYWQPRLPIRQKLAAWSTGGSRKIEDLAHETVVEALSNHKPAPIDRDIEKRIMEIYKKFQKRVRH